MSIPYRLPLNLMTASALVPGGCALSPQQLDPRPVLKGSLTAVGHGQPVVTKVVDGRPGPSLGTRGGLYADTSILTVCSKDAMPKFQVQVEIAMRLSGYMPSASIYNAPQLTLTLAELKHQSPKNDVYVIRTDIIATSRADVQNNNRRYVGRYGVFLNQRFGTAPNRAANSKLVSKVLSDVLICVFKDPTITQTLSQQ